MRPDTPLTASELRRRADILHREKYPAARDEPESAPLRLIHELQVHQIELELQNEELQKSRLEVEAGLQGYTELYDFAPVGYLTLDRAEAILQVNLAGASLLGVERAHLVGARLGRFVAEAERAVFKAFLEKVFAGRAKESCLVALRTQGALPVWVQLTAIAQVGALSCQVVMQDITEQHALEGRLRTVVQEKEAANQLLQAMIDGMEDTVVMVDASYQVLQMNRAARAQLGEAEARRLAQGGAMACHQLSHQQSEPCAGSDHPCPLNLVLQSGETTKVIHTHARANGEPFPVELVATPIRDLENTVIGIIEVGRDISERARLDEARKRLVEQEFRQQKEKTIATLAGGIAHDFNNLLMGVMGNAELLGMQATEAGVRQKISAIVQAGKRMAHLTRQLQAFAKTDPCHLEVLDINALLRETMKQIPLAHPITLELALGEDLWPVAIDRDQLDQLLHNLLQNAAESMAEAGGLLTLTTQNLRQAASWTCALGMLHAPGEFVRLTVADSGSGIADDIRPRIFDPFFSTKFVGRGLGLAAVIGIVQRQGGGICLETSTQGTTISVLLPRAEPVPAPAPLKPAGPAASLHAGPGPDNKVVLVVDDDRTILLLAKAILEGAGLRVVTAADGQEAETFWSQHLGQICFAILDVQLPDIDGKILYTRLKLLNPALPVLMNSGHSQEAALEGLQLRPGDLFLQKPYNFKELVGLVQSALVGKPAAAV